MYTEEQYKQQEKSNITDEKNKFNQLDELIEKYQDKEESIIKLLHQTQEIFGFLPRQVLLYLSKKTNIPFAEIYGVVSFYSLFSMEPRGESTIEVCMGTACYVKGAEDILDQLKKELKIEPGEVSEDGRYSLEVTRCVGACSLAPVVSVDAKVYSKVKPEDVSDILAGKIEVTKNKEELQKERK